jgi:hypothetical protein
MQKKLERCEGASMFEKGPANAAVVEGIRRSFRFLGHELGAPDEHQGPVLTNGNLNHEGTNRPSANLHP